MGEVGGTGSAITFPDLANKAGDKRKPKFQERRDAAEWGQQPKLV